MADGFATMKVAFNDGSTASFEIPEDDENVSAKIERLVELNGIAMEVEGNLLFLPLHNIRSIEISPAPVMSIANVLPGVRRVF